MFGLRRVFSHLVRRGAQPVWHGGFCTIPGTKAKEAYLFVYTCKVCEFRSERKISKHAYHKGVVLVKCPGCGKQHLVADNLKWFEDKPVNVEDLVRRNGELAVTGDLVHVDGQEEANEEEQLAENFHPK